MKRESQLRLSAVTNQTQLTLNEAVDIIEALTRVAGDSEFAKLIWENALFASDAVIRELTPQNVRAAYQKIASEFSKGTVK